MIHSGFQQFNNLDHAHKVLRGIYTRMAAATEEINKIGAAKSTGEEYISTHLVELGLFLGRVTIFIKGCRTLNELGYGWVRSLNHADNKTVGIVEQLVFNVTKTEYKVGQLVAVLPIADGLFVASDAE